MWIQTTQALICLSLLVAGQAGSSSRPDFSGKWEENPPAAGRTLQSMVVRQEAKTITVEIPPDQRWSFNLDGSPSTNVNVQGTARVEQVSTATWDGSKLIISTSVPSGSRGAITIKQVWSLKDRNLVIASTITNDGTGAILQDIKQTFSASRSPLHLAAS